MSKLCSLQEAVATIKDGTSVAMGCALESLIPFAAGYEIMRQQREELTLIAPISDKAQKTQLPSGEELAAVRKYDPKGVWTNNSSR
jgi:acyl CoA:acetate/3-ketoacid CoA transferase alpha subunit